MNRTTDHSTELLERLCEEANHDRNVLNTLFEAARPRLLRLIAVRAPASLGQRVDAEDIVQETFVTATQRFDAFLDDRRVPVLVWLRGLAIDRLIDQQRRHLGAARRAVSREIEKRDWLRETSFEMANLWQTDAKSPSKILSDKQRSEDLKKALQSLPDHYREILVLRFFESLSVNEAAAAMGYSQSNAKVLQFRAIKKLHDLMRHNHDWDSNDQTN